MTLWAGWDGDGVMDKELVGFHAAHRRRHYASLWTKGGVHAWTNFVDRTFDLKGRLDASTRLEMTGVH